MRAFTSAISTKVLIQHCSVSVLKKAFWRNIAPSTCESIKAQLPAQWSTIAGVPSNYYEKIELLQITRKMADCFHRNRNKRRNSLWRKSKFPEIHPQRKRSSAVFRPASVEYTGTETGSKTAPLLLSTAQT